MNRFKKSLLVIGLVSLSVIVLVGLRLGQRHHAPSTNQTASTPPPPSTSANTTTTPHVFTGVPPDVAAILAESDEVVRLNRLAAWCDHHTLDEIHAAWLASVGGHVPVNIPLDSPLFHLACAKLADLHPGVPENEMLSLQHQLILKDNTTAPTNAHAVLRVLTNTDPTRAFQETLDKRMPENTRTFTLLASLTNIARTDPDQALKLLASTRRLPRNDAFRAIARGWATTAPQAAFDWALTNFPPGSFVSPLQTIVDTWADADLDSAVAAALPHLPNPALDDSMGYLLKRWLAASPAASAAWIQKQDSLPEPMLHAAIDAMASTQPQLAIALLARPMDDSTRTAHTETIASLWSKTDPDSARQWLNTLPHDRGYLAAANAIAGNLAQRSSAGAIAFYNSLPPDIDRSKIITTLAQNLTDSPAALNWLLAMPESPPPDAISAVISRLSTEQATSLIASIPSGPLRDAAYASLSANQYHQHRSTFTDWLRSLPDAATQAAALEGNNSYYWSQSNPDEVIAFANTLPAGPALDTLISYASRILIQRDPASAIDWLLPRQASSNAKNQLTTAFAALAANSSDAAVQRLQTIPAGLVHIFAFSGVIQSLAKTSPETAAATLLAQGDSTEQQRYVRLVVEHWTDQDAHATTAWTRALPTGDLRDAALSTLAYQLAKTDNASVALDLSTLAQSDEARLNITRSALLGLQMKNDQQAQAALDRMTLSTADRQQLQAELNAYR